MLCEIGSCEIFAVCHHISMRQFVQYLASQPDVEYALTCGRVAHANILLTPPLDIVQDNVLRINKHPPSPDIQVVKLCDIERLERRTLSDPVEYTVHHARFCSSDRSTADATSFQRFSQINLVLEPPRIEEPRSVLNRIVAFVRAQNLNVLSIYDVEERFAQYCGCLFDLIEAATATKSSELPCPSTLGPPSHAELTVRQSSPSAAHTAHQPFLSAGHKVLLPPLPAGARESNQHFTVFSFDILRPGLERSVLAYTPRVDRASIRSYYPYAGADYRSDVRCPRIACLIAHYRSDMILLQVSRSSFLPYFRALAAFLQEVSADFYKPIMDSLGPGYDCVMSQSECIIYKLSKSVGFFIIIMCMSYGRGKVNNSKALISIYFV